MADTNPQRGITFACPCGCEHEYGVPNPDGWLLVPDDVDDAALRSLMPMAVQQDPAQHYEVERAARMGIRSFLHHHGSTKAKGVTPNG